MRRILPCLFFCIISVQLVSCINANAKKIENLKEYREYKIVSERNIGSLETAVELKLFAGYSLIGGISYDGTNYNQAVAK